MPESASHLSIVDAQFVLARGRDVDVARARLCAARHEAPRQWDAQPLRDDLLAALEEFVTVAARAGVPLSYRLRAEINLYRHLGRQR
jgi:hypothetical protein